MSSIGTKDIIEKYSKKLESRFSYSEKKDYSEDYLKFRKEMMPVFSRYERLCKSFGTFAKVKLSEKNKKIIQSNLQLAQLDLTPEQAMSLSLVSFGGIFLLSVIISAAFYIISPQNASSAVIFCFLGIIASFIIFYHTYTMPQRIANSWRLKASSQMVPAILYIVVYMKHTSNLERAIQFASEHLEGPLALDFKKIFYDVEIGKYSSIKQSLDFYLEKWRFYAPEFIEAVHLIESSLYEPSDARRIMILEKSLQVILDGVYEKMLHYSREIRSPLTNVYMLGVILPTLALAMLPLASALVGGSLKWQHFVILFNVIIPFLVFYMTSEILLKRPGGYGESSILELNPDYYKFASKKPWLKATLISLPLFLIGLIPFIFQFEAITSFFHLKSDYSFSEIGLKILSDMKFFQFMSSTDTQTIVGPFGVMASLLSMFIPVSVAIFFSLAYSNKTTDLMKSREKSKTLEEEFTNSLFQLGNRLADGIPAEIAFSRVAASTQGQTTAEFFSEVNRNIQEGGMSVEKAIFDKKSGALITFPSEIISTSMRILVESVKKGLQVAASSLMSISEYSKNIQKINQRLRDLLAEIISDMKSNMTFLAPLLAGIVVGLTTMITLILTKLSAITSLSGGEEMAGLGGVSAITEIFKVEQTVPPYFMQIITGFYIIEIIFILTIALVTINSGKDTLREKSEIAKNLKKGFILYILTALITTIVLSILSAIALGNLGT
jgi:Flp pilus assembly protein TadB